MNPIQFYTSVDVTLSEKLLEIMYFSTFFHVFGVENLDNSMWINF